MSLGPILMFDVLTVVVRRREEAVVACHASHGGTFFLHKFIWSLITCDFVGFHTIVLLLFFLCHSSSASSTTSVHHHDSSCHLTLWLPQQQQQQQQQHVVVIIKYVSFLVPCFYHISPHVCHITATPKGVVVAVAMMAMTTHCPHHHHR